MHQTSFNKQNFDFNLSQTFAKVNLTKSFFVLNEAQKLFKDLKVKLDQSWLSCRRQNIAKTFDGNVLFFSEVQSMFSPSLGRQNDAHSM